MKKYCLSAEAFRQRFRSIGKKDSEGYPEFAYSLKANLVEWFKSAEAYESREMIMECMCLEQFYKSIPQLVKLWVQDRGNVNTVERAAELAEEYAARRKLSAEDGSWYGWNRPWKQFPLKKALQTKRPEHVDAEKKTSEKSDEKLNGETVQKKQKKEFESYKQIRCYKCHKLGHIAVNCGKSKVVFFLRGRKRRELGAFTPISSRPARSWKNMQGATRQCRHHGHCPSVLRDGG